MNQRQAVILGVLFLLINGINNTLKNWMSGETTFVILFAFITAICLVVFACQFTALPSKKWFKGFVLGFACIVIVIFFIDFINGLHKVFS